ncbi:hypothetical protein I4F81_009753 [Pyropia yezoensis]|uniref:Uncharacterized protein n=1 Tax=Pyropia yezoensis TaxID=2788 RepID=A0ACC3CBT3_PYRYE|nr:hypothetical protein I4F81_009753 [Neopyropia yezoensis]
MHVAVCTGNAGAAARDKAEKNHPTAPARRPASPAGGRGGCLANTNPQRVKLPRSRYVEAMPCGQRAGWVPGRPPPPPKTNKNSRGSQARGARLRPGNHSTRLQCCRCCRRRGTSAALRVGAIDGWAARPPPVATRRVGGGGWDDVRRGRPAGAPPSPKWRHRALNIPARSSVGGGRRGGGQPPPRPPPPAAPPNRAQAPTGRPYWQVVVLKVVPAHGELVAGKGCYPHRRGHHLGHHRHRQYRPVTGADGRKRKRYVAWVLQVHVQAPPVERRDERPRHEAPVHCSARGGAAHIPRRASVRKCRGRRQRCA